MKNYALLPFLFLIFSVSIMLGQEVSLDDAWNKIKTYKYGDDFKPLLMVEQAIEASTTTPEQKAKTAARLAAMLNDETSYPGRQFICMQLRLVGGAAEVPKLSEYLNRPEDAENARLALADIRCEESLVPLRKALDTFKGRTLVGVIGSLAARNDVKSIPRFVKLLDSDDKTVATTAATALGRFGGEGVSVLEKKFEPFNLAVCAALVAVAADQVSKGQKRDAKQLYNMLSSSECPKGIRRAALEGSLRLLETPERRTTIVNWFFNADPQKRIIATSRLKELSSEEFNLLFKKIDQADVSGRVALFEVASKRRSKELLDALLTTLLKAAESSDMTERVTALRTLGKFRNATAIPVLLKSLDGDTETRNAASEALLRYDTKIVGPKLVDALKDSSIRNQAVELIVALKYYDAINPMVEWAKNDNETIFEPMTDGLGKLCDPDEHDIPRLLDLYLVSRPGRHRDCVERAVVVVCEKQADPNVRANLLLDRLPKQNGVISDDILTATLPLLGKVGNKRVAELVAPLLQSNQPGLKNAAVRALCNWPSADYSNELWNIATKDVSSQYRQWALRAYIRVVTLKSDRPAVETLDMLKKAMNAAESNAEKQLCLERAGAIRTLDSVLWLSSFLDDENLNQMACKSIVELAHHRFLREPNKAKFEPILLRVEKTTKNKDVAERALKARLGM